jgi:hypothetical protein
MTFNENETALAADGAAPFPANQSPRCLTRTRYLMAGLVGLMTPAPVILLYQADPTMLNDALLFLILLFSALYLFETLKRMVVEFFDFKPIIPAATLFFGSIIFYVSLALLSLLLLGHQALAVDLASATLMERIFFYVAIAGLFGLSMAVSFVGFELGNMEYSFLLLTLLRYVLLVLGVSLMGEVLGVVLLFITDRPIIIALILAMLTVTDYLIILTYGFTCLLSGFIFVLMAYRYPAYTEKLKELSSSKV